MTQYVSKAVQEILTDIFRTAPEQDCGVYMEKGWNTNAVCSAEARGYITLEIYEGELTFTITDLGKLILQNTSGDFKQIRNEFMALKKAH